MSEEVQTLEVETGTNPEDPLRRDVEAFPGCIDSCLVYKLLDGQGQDCAYHTLRHAAARGKKAVLNVLDRRVPAQTFGVLVERGADAPCITNLQERHMIDSVIAAKDHNDRSKAEHVTRRRKEKEEYSQRGHRGTSTVVLEDHSEELSRTFPAEKTGIEGVYVAVDKWFRSLLS